jgi:hypothetical protein
MRKYVFLTTLFLLLLKISSASAGVAANGMEVDPETLGIVGIGNFPSEIFWGTGSNRIETLGIGGSGMEIPRDFSISTERPFRMEYSREIGPGAL